MNEKSRKSTPAPLVPDIMTTLELARYLRCSRQYLEIARVRGNGPPFSRLGKMVRYRRSVVDAWIASREITSTSAPRT